MKTTDGKTQTPTTGERAIHIYEERHGKLIASVKATSLKDALKRYFESTLSGYGYTKPKHTGNTLTVTDKQGRPKLYVALETYQQHVLS